jgi:hypothetical protein
MLLSSKKFLNKNSYLAWASFIFVLARILDPRKIKGRATLPEILDVAHKRLEPITRPFPAIRSLL